MGNAVWFAPKPDEEDVAYVADNMRLADVAEVWALSRLSPKAALDISIALTSVAYTAYVGLRPAAVFGVSSAGHLGGVGRPWFLGTDLVKQNSRALLHHTAPFLKHHLTRFRLLENDVHAENRDAIRFLRWAGFTMSQPYTTHTGAEAIRFSMERQDV